MGATVIVVCGPTASGKTDLGVELALALGGEVVSADSMQIYRGMDIGTAKPTPREMRGIPHHMLNVADPWEDYSVARYIQEASLQVDGILARGRLPILVGGTGLYLDHLVAGREFAPFSGQWRDKLQGRAAEEGISALYAELAGIDPERAQRLHPNDEKRIIRALEVWYETGETITDHDRRTQAMPPRYRALRIGLDFVHRTDLHARIDARVDRMARQGLVEEVRGLLESGLSPRCTAMQAIGYKEVAAALRSGGDLTAALEEVKLRSRQYAKRQLTWFRRDPQVWWIKWNKFPDLAFARQEATTYLEESGLP